MDPFLLLPLLFIISLTFISFNLFTHKNGRNQPPSPPSFPVIGHLHLIKDPVHRNLHHLSSTYGPIMALRFGSRPVLVVTSPSAVEDCFTTNDVVLANRPLLLTGKYLDYDHTTIGSSPYGPRWRDLRRIATLELFSTVQLKHYTGFRQEELTSFIKDLYNYSQDGGFTSVEMKSRIRGLSFNVIMRIVADKRFYGTEVDDFEEAEKFKEIIGDIFEIGGASNPGDFIPVLRWFDFQGYEKRLKELHGRSDGFVQSLIEERRRRRGSDEGKAKTFIDAMLSLQETEPECYTDDIIKGNISTLLLAGTDTSAGTVEWAMSLLVNHPHVLKRARTEVDEYIRHQRLAEETDLPNLPYMQCIINETLRLFPAAPLLVPHEPSQDCTIGGFHVARGTMVLVNAWAIHRDPEIWDDPLIFKPERFENLDTVNLGYRFIPFGMGRRRCPGSGLANRVMALTLASLIQCFEWERVGEEMVELSEGKGITMPKKVALEVMCRPRQELTHVLKEL